MHFCSTCETAMPHQDPDAARATATCKQCGTENKIPSVPLFVITGGSGCGKSTVSLGLLRKRNPYLIVDADFLFPNMKSFGSWDSFYNFTCIVSLTLARNLRPIVLVGGMSPSQIEQARTSEFFSAVHFLVIACDEATQTARLQGRTLFDGSTPATAESINNAIKQANWIVGEADSRSYVTVLDTTDLTQDQTISAADRWILDRLDD